MPIKTCRSDGKPGFRWGEGACYTYEVGDDDAKNSAKKKAIRQAIAAGASRKELKSDLDTVGIRLMAEAEAELETEDMGEVEVLAVGGPINGIGSPRGGEYATADRVAEIASDTRELEEELKPYLKLGHSLAQRTLRDAGLTDDEGNPSIGRFRDFRLSEDGKTIKAKLDRVPKIVARLMRAGAYTRLSAELYRLGKQSGDGDGEPRLVIKGVALLGAQTPAVRTLDEVVKLFAGKEDEGDELVAGDAVLLRELEEGEVIWEPDRGFEGIRAALNEALNPGPGESRYWVQDVSLNTALDSDTPAQALGGTAIVTEYGASPDAWMVSFERDDATGEITLAASEGWVPAEQAWVESSRSFAEKNLRAADTRPMPDLTLNEEQQRALAAELGLEDEDELTPEKLLEAAKTKGETEGGEGDGTEEGGNGNGGGDDEAAKELERRLAAAETTANETAEELRLEKRRSFVEDFVLGSGRAEPGQREAIETLYDKDPVAARKFFEDVAPDDTLAREFGTDGDEGPDEETAEAAEQAEKEEIARNLNIPVEEVV